MNDTSMVTNSPASFDDLSALSGDAEQAAQEPPKPARPPFCPPFVKIGDIVYWYSSAKRTNRACPLLINDVEGNVVSGHVFAKGKLPLPVTGIRHIDDPHLQTHQFVAVKDGAWDRKG